MLKVIYLSICLFDLGDFDASDERRLALNFDRQLPGTQTTDFLPQNRERERERKIVWLF